MKELAIGLMSGTSADGVSAVLAAFDKNQYRVLSYRTYAYTGLLSSRIRNASLLSAAQLSSLNFELGHLFGKYAADLLRRARVKRERISVIGSHGQTVLHAPMDKPAHTLQIGEPAAIMERTGITVVSDFRPADVTAGGQGAPLIPYFDQFFFGRGKVHALQNIGGIANVTVVGSRVKTPLAFDNGPGNCLMDWAVREATDQRLSCDKGGAMAIKGRLWKDAAEQLGRHPYFLQKPPKSTGRELFNETFIPPKLRALMRQSPWDGLRTLTYFTAYAIAQSYARFVLDRYDIKEVVVSGGGALNLTLMQDLAELLSPMRVRSMETYGIHPQAKEPLAFAFFAWRAIHGRPNHLPAGTGAKHASILGKITPGPRFRGLR